MAANFLDIPLGVSMVTGQGLLLYVRRNKSSVSNRAIADLFGGRQMKFAHFSHVWNKPGMTAAERYEQLWRELETCDELGFDFGFTVEHHFNPNESWMPSPAIYCTG